jgi:hypothetical protein
MAARETFPLITKLEIADPGVTAGTGVGVVGWLLHAALVETAATITTNHMANEACRRAGIAALLGRQGLM